MKLDKQITMPKVMKMITAIGILVTLVTMIIYQNNNSSIFLTLAITFGTITYLWDASADRMACYDPYEK